MRVATGAGRGERRAVVITVSSRAAAGVYTDDAGPAVADRLAAAGFDVGEVVVVPDGRGVVAEAIVAAAGEATLVVTSGGTGLHPKDETPEATRDVCDRLVPGLGELMRSASLEVTPMAALSRAVVGLRDRVLVVNLPGSPKGAVENLAAVLPCARSRAGPAAGRRSSAPVTSVRPDRGSGRFALRSPMSRGRPSGRAASPESVVLGVTVSPDDVRSRRIAPRAVDTDPRARGAPRIPLVLTDELRRRVRQGDPAARPRGAGGPPTRPPPTHAEPHRSERGARPRSAGTPGRRGPHRRAAPPPPSAAVDPLLGPGHPGLRRPPRGLGVVDARDERRRAGDVPVPARAHAADPCDACTAAPPADCPRCARRSCAEARGQSTRSSFPSSRASAPGGRRDLIAQVTTPDAAEARHAGSVGSAPRGCSSVGRAPRSHRGGQGFDSPQLHLTCVIQRAPSAPARTSRPGS